MQSFSSLIQNSFAFLEVYFLELLFAVSLPLIVTYLFAWTTSGMYINKINAITNYQQLLDLFSLQSGINYFAIIAVLVIAVTSLIGLISAPLVAVKHKDLTIRTIFPETLKYFWSFLGFAVLASVAYIIFFLIGSIINIIIAIVIGLFSVDLLNQWQAYFGTVIPTLFTLIAVMLLVFGPYVLIDKHEGPWHAVITSIELVFKHFWGILIRLFVMLIPLTVIVLLLQFVPIVGFPLASILGLIISTAYIYTMYQDLITE